MRDTTTYTGRRITPDEVMEAYRETGLTPARQLYSGVIAGKACGCGVGVLLVQAGIFEVGDAGNAEYETILRVLGISDGYWFGYGRGFDGKPMPEEMNPDRAAGYEDGRACARAAFGEGGGN